MSQRRRGVRLLKIPSPQCVTFLSCEIGSGWNARSQMRGLRFDGEGLTAKRRGTQGQQSQGHTSPSPNPYPGPKLVDLYTVICLRFNVLFIDFVRVTNWFLWLWLVLHLNLTLIHNPIHKQFRDSLLPSIFTPRSESESSCWELLRPRTKVLQSDNTGEWAVWVTTSYT